MHLTLLPLIMIICGKGSHTSCGSLGREEFEDANRLEKVRLMTRIFVLVLIVNFLLLKLIHVEFL